ncbi:MAG: cation:proton antiporter [Propionibacteriaceae bacterium]|nr:cation:proton antiporter [Propionibacteriaceae bacterium]
MEVTTVFLLLGVALAAGLGALALKLPPLVGFLSAGFLLNAFGVVPPEELQPLSDVGVTLLLFTIGLKFDVRVITRREVWATFGIHMLASTLVAMGFLGVLVAVFGMSAGWGSLAMLGFACSFSSTVLCVKVMEDRGDDRSLYGQSAIGILLMQDLAAVVFMATAKGSPPSVWALALPVVLVPVVWFARVLLGKIGRGELLVLFGVVIALVPGWWAFEQVGLKGDLGALAMGLLLGTHPLGNELSRQLTSVKELLLIGFFVSIGFYGLPGVADMLIAFALVFVLMPLKMWGYGWLITAFGLRARTGAKAALVLSSLSEFGIIVAAVGVSTGRLDKPWLVTIALAVALSMVVSTLLNMREARFSERAAHWLPERDPDHIVEYDRIIDLTSADVLVLGMGRIGRAAYDRLAASGQEVWGVESDEARARELSHAGYRILEEDATDAEFWRRVRAESHVDLVLLAMPNHESNAYASHQLNESAFEGSTAAVVRYPTEAEELSRIGVDTVFNFYEGAGIVLADRGMEVDRIRQAGEAGESGGETPEDDDRPAA